MNGIIKKRQINERKYNNYEKLSNGGRRYWFQVKGKLGYTAKYVKEVNNKEEVIRFYQEIYNVQMELIEIHEKFPIDKGHKKIGSVKIDMKKNGRSSLTR